MITRTNQLLLKELFLTYEAKSAFRSLRRNMLCRRIASLVFPFYRDHSGAVSSSEDHLAAFPRRLPVVAIRGVARRDGSIGPFPIPARKLERFWTMMWLIEDIDAIPEAAVVNINDHWYLADDTKSIVIYLMLRQKGAISFSVYPTGVKKPSDCQLHDFSENNCEEKLASAV